MNSRRPWDRARRIPPKTFVLLAMLGITIIAFGITKGAKERDEWSLFPSNEIKGGKSLPVLYLSGKFNQTWRPTSGSPAPRRGEFEIYMRGTDYYFLKCWHGNPTNMPSAASSGSSHFVPFVGSGLPGWWQIQLIVSDLEFTMGRTWGPFGAKSGGGGGAGRANWLAPGRRLWNQSGFVGAVEEGQVNKEWYATEVFKSVKQVGEFKIPRVIEFDRGDSFETYTIRKCEFRNEPTVDWFLAQRKEYCGSYQDRLKSAVTNSPSLN